MFSHVKKYTKNLMETVVYPTNDFNFNNITLGQPSVVQGGSYFTKISNNSKPIYLQTPSCFTKQGITVSGKKAYCDLMYTNEDLDILTWFEKLVEKLQELIFDKRKLWFHNDMDMEDIDSAFTQPMRTYKGGKFYLVRTIIQGSHINNPLQGFSCYDENENKVDPELLKDNKQIIPLIEIKGVKFSSKSFQIDIALKQTMVMDDEQPLNNCLIKVNNAANNTDTDTDNTVRLEITEHDTSKPIVDKNVIISNDTKLEIAENTEDTTNIVSGTENTEDTPNIVSGTENIVSGTENTVSDIENTLSDTEDTEEVSGTEGIEDNTDNIPLLTLVGLEEVDINTDDIEYLEENEKTINLISQNDQYVELWEEARRKAKQARKAAIGAHLDAKKIKAKHMLENLDDDSDDDYFDEYVESLENVDLEM